MLFGHKSNGLGSSHFDGIFSAARQSVGGAITPTTGHQKRFLCQKICDITENSDDCSLEPKRISSETTATKAAAV